MYCHGSIAVRTVLAVALLSTASAEGVLVNNGIVNEINAANSFPLDSVEVRQGPGGAVTTVNIVPGGAVGTAGGYSFPLGVFDNSVVNLSGGEVWRAVVTDNSVFKMSSGTLNLLETSGSAQIEFTGGGVVQRFTHNSSLATISGGGFWVIDAGGDLAISGGSYTRLNSLGTSKSTFTGGTLESLRAFDSTEVTFVGRDFNFPYGDIPIALGVLTGTLADGTVFSTDFGRATNARITLVAVPEASQILLFGVLTLVSCVLNPRLKRAKN